MSGANICCLCCCLTLLPQVVAASSIVAVVVAAASALDENFVDFDALVGIGFACQNLLELSLFFSLPENCFPLGWLQLVLSFAARLFVLSLSLSAFVRFVSHANATRCYSLCTFN